MKKLSLLCGCLILSSSPFTAYAKSSDPLKTQGGYEIGLEVSNYKYEEEVDGQFFMSNQGKKLGFTFSATTILKNDWFATLDVRHSRGDVEYKSSSSTGSDVPDHLWDIRGLMGADIELGSQMISPYFGLGYRNLFNDLRALGSSGYRRESEYVYLPLGITHRFSTGGKSRVSTSFEYDYFKQSGYFLKGTQKSYLSDVDSGFNNPINNQTKGYGFRMSVAYEEQNWSAGLFFNRWNFDDSDWVDLTYYGIPTGFIVNEPSNITNETGIRVKYHF